MLQGRAAMRQPALAGLVIFVATAGGRSCACNMRSDAVALPGGRSTAIGHGGRARVVTAPVLVSMSLVSLPPALLGMTARRWMHARPSAAIRTLRVTRRARPMEDETRVRRLRFGLLGSPSVFDVLVRSVKGRVRRRSVSDMQQRTNRNHKDAALIRRVRAARSARQRGETERLAHWKDRDGG